MGQPWLLEQARVEWTRLWETAFCYDGFWEAEGGVFIDKTGFNNWFKFETLLNAKNRHPNFIWKYLILKIMGMEIKKVYCTIERTHMALFLADQEWFFENTSTFLAKELIAKTNSWRV